MGYKDIIVRIIAIWIKTMPIHSTSNINRFILKIRSYEGLHQGVNASCRIMAIIWSEVLGYIRRVCRIIKVGLGWEIR